VQNPQKIGRFIFVDSVEDLLLCNDGNLFGRNKHARKFLSNFSGGTARVHPKFTFRTGSKLAKLIIWLFSLTALPPHLLPFSALGFWVQEFFA
jgi:hypothetical protein